MTGKEHQKGTQTTMVSRRRHIPSACAAVMRVFGFLSSILVIKSLAAPDIECHGLLSRSSFPFLISSNIPASVSEIVSKTSEFEKVRRNAYKTYTCKETGIP